MGGAHVVTAADALRLAADMLVSGEDALNLLARRFDHPPFDLGPIRGDVVMIAAWLDEHPDVDEQLRSVLALETT